MRTVQYSESCTDCIKQILADTSFVSQKNCDDIISYRVEKTSGTDDRFSALIHIHASPFIFILFHPFRSAKYLIQVKTFHKSLVMACLWLNIFPPT